MIAICVHIFWLSPSPDLKLYGLWNSILHMFLIGFNLMLMGLESDVEYGNVFDKLKNIPELN